MQNLPVRPRGSGATGMATMAMALFGTLLPHHFLQYITLYLTKKAKKVKKRIAVSGIPSHSYCVYVGF